MRNVVCERNNKWLYNTSVTHRRTMAGLGKSIRRPSYLPSRSFRTHPVSLQGCLSCLRPGIIMLSIHKIRIILEQEKEESINPRDQKRKKKAKNKNNKKTVCGIGIHKMLSEHLTASETKRCVTEGPLKDSCWVSDHHRSQLPNLTQKSKNCYYFVPTVDYVLSKWAFSSHSTNRRPWHLWVALVHCSAVQRCLIS